MTTSTIRAATVADAELLARLNAWVHDLHVDKAPDVFKQTDLSEVVSWFRTMLDSSTVRGWIAEDAGTPVGYVLAMTHARDENVFCSARSFCEIDQIAVSPAFQKQGVARALVEQVSADARSRGILNIELTSSAFNEDAHAAFRVLGFKPKTIRFAR